MARVKIEDLLDEISYKENLQNQNKITNDEENGLIVNTEHLLPQTDEELL